MTNFLTKGTLVSGEVKYQLELYYFPECPYCQLVIDAIDSLGLTSIKHFNTRQNTRFSEKLMKDTGRRTVPCLYVNGRPMHESKVIINWLKENSDDIS